MSSIIAAHLGNCRCIIKYFYRKLKYTKTVKKEAPVTETAHEPQKRNPRLLLRGLHFIHYLLKIC